MKPLLSRGAALVLGPLFAVLFGVLLYLLDTNPRGVLRSIEGEIVSRTPTTTKGELSGFRICVGSDAQTFTYAEPAPDVDHAWKVVSGASRAFVQYSDGVGNNPVLWGLQAGGEVLATPAQLERARTTRFYLYAFGFVLALGAFGAALLRSLKSNKRRSVNAAT